METREMVTARGQTNLELADPSEMNNAINLLNGLIDDNRGIVQIYETAVSHLQTEANNDLLQRYAAQHHSFISELSNLVVSFGGAPNTNTNGNAIFKQIWISLKAVLSDGDGPIMKEVAQATENILETYGETMNEAMPDTARNMIRRQMSETRVTCDKLSALDTVYNS